MDLRQLEHFVAVAGEQSFTRAALKLNIVQSGLSASIRALEEELGVALFIRTTRRVDLTPTGRAFLIEARRVLAAASDARRIVEEMQCLHRGTLSIGMIQGIAPLVDVAALLGRFHTACPSVDIRLIAGDSLSLIDAVKTGELDIAFTQFLGSPPSGLNAWMLACEEMTLVCPPGHRFNGRTDLMLSDLTEESFVDLGADWGTRQLIDRHFAESRLTRRTGFEVNDLSTQFDLVAHGLGIALVPNAVIPNAPAFGTARLAGPEMCWELVIMFAEDHQRHPASAVVRRFLDLVRDSVIVLDEVATSAAE